ncbi:TPA: hypothetical protein ACPJ0L_002578 [Vibrio alginolyticus]|uniref:hypothetical protein n=1 Tax=Vibrio alginolyticus TaxID=663 RepID=UPI00215F2093|nr:hypothetical protein [Vibrio alginolyticus]MCS0133235.1 hypothetical protein [Vibrio alginolyticus]
MLTAEQLSDDLVQLGEFLESKNIIKSANPLIDAGALLIRSGGKRCFIKGLELEPVEGDYIRGKEWDSELNIIMTIDISVKDKFCFEDVVKIIVNLEYETLHVDDARLCRGAWHFDYHVDMDGTGEEEQYRYIHPHYHVHHGGKKVKKLDSYGDMIVLKSPRLMHHPLDAFLAIDLILSNFLDLTIWKQLRANTQYKLALKESQLNWWKPYYEKLGNYWETMGNSTLKDAKQNLSAMRDLNPHLL